VPARFDGNAGAAVYWDTSRWPQDWRPVIDRTGLTGRFDIDVELEATRASIPVLVIDHIEMPAN
jgi:hypothetical protein